MKKLLIFTAALLLILTACAPPKEKFNPDAISSDSPDYRPFTAVDLSEADYEKQAQILTVRLSDYVNRRDEIAVFIQFYEGLCRYALVCVEPTGKKTDQWILFCYETNEKEVIIENARLLEITSKDNITFIRSGYFPEQNRYRFPEVVRVLRNGGSALTIDSTAWLPLSYEANVGLITDTGSPKTYPVLQLLDNFYLTDTGVQMAFRRYVSTAIDEPPFCKIQTNPSAQTVTVTYIGATIGQGVQRELTGSAIGCFEKAQVRQSGNRVVITLTLRTSDLLYHYQQSDTYIADSDLCNITELQFRPTQTTTSQSVQ